MGLKTNLLHPNRGGGEEFPRETFRLRQENSTVVPELACMEWKSDTVARLILHDI